MIARPKRLLGLDVGTSCIKAVEFTVQPKQLPKVTGMAFSPLKSAEDLKPAVKEVLRRGGFHTKLTCSNVSGRLVSIKYITLPPMSDEEMKKALPFEADKYIPFEVKDSILDAQRISPAGQGTKEMTAVLVAAKRNLILERAAFLSDVGLLPSVVDVDAFAIGNAFELGLKALGGAVQDRSVAVVDVGATKTSINILKGAATYFTREIYLAGNDLSDGISKKLGLSPGEAEELKCAPGDREQACRDAVSNVVDDLANEIRMSFEFYENQYEANVEEVFLCGGGARFSGFSESLGAVFGKPVRLWNPFERLQSEGAGLEPEALALAGGTMAVAVGLASRLGMP